MLFNERFKMRVTGKPRIKDTRIIKRDYLAILKENATHNAYLYSPESICELENPGLR